VVVDTVFQGDMRQQALHLLAQVFG
jgi:hypothetical protein